MGFNQLRYQLIILFIWKDYPISNPSFITLNLIYSLGFQLFVLVGTKPAIQLIILFPNIPFMKNNKNVLQQHI